MADRPDPVKFVFVETTLPTTPLPLSSSRRNISTRRLLLRSLEAGDLENVHALRQEEDVMKWTSEGRIDRDIAESQNKLSQFLPPNDAVKILYAICLKETGEFLGMGGMVDLEANFGWPGVSYLLNKKTWGQGYATEFLGAFVNEYFALPRSRAQIRVDARTLSGPRKSQERLTANTVDHNVKSQKVLEKCGFERMLRWSGRRCVMSSFQYFPPPTTFHDEQL